MKTTPVGFEPTQGDPIGLAGRRLSRSAKVSMASSQNAAEKISTATGAMTHHHCYNAPCALAAARVPLCPCLASPQHVFHPARSPVELAKPRWPNRPCSLLRPASLECERFAAEHPPKHAHAFFSRQRHIALKPRARDRMALSRAAHGKDGCEAHVPCGRAKGDEEYTEQMRAHSKADKRNGQQHFRTHNLPARNRSRPRNSQKNTHTRTRTHPCATHFCSPAVGTQTHTNNKNKNTHTHTPQKRRSETHVSGEL